MSRLVALAAAAVALAGCGGGDDRLTKEEYQAEVRKVGTTLSGALGGVDTEGAGGLSAVEQQVEQLQSALRDAAAELKDLSPPEDVEGAHEKLVQGIRGFADDLDELDDALEREDLGAIRSFENDFTSSDSVKQIREAAAELQEKGYSLE